MSDRSRSLPLVLVLSLALSLGACTDATAPSPGAASPAAVKFWEAGSSVAWNTTARELIASRGSSAVAQSRILAYLSVAQFNAIVAADAARGSSRPSAAAAAAGASVVVLKSFFPLDVGLIDARAAAQAAAAPWPGEQTADFAAGDAIGRAIGASVVAYAATDGVNQTPVPPNPGGPGHWTGVNSIPGLFGVRPFSLESGSQFRSDPPPAFGSPEFVAALAEVRAISDTRTPAQLALAQFWNTRGSAYLNGVATSLIVAHHRTEREAARILALANMATFDATIGCFDAKFAYFYIRPPQADPMITTPVGMPNHPSYPSGHSCQTSALATVLASAFPEDRAYLEGLIIDAGLARVYAGIHYDFDCEAGQELGRNVAAWVLQAFAGKPESIALD